jgi:hypothetical protein
MFLFCFQCEGKLADRIVAKMKEDCEAKKDDLAAVRDLFDNIELVCAAKGIDIEIHIPTGDVCPTTTLPSTTTTTPTTTTTTTPTTTTTTTTTPPPTTTTTCLEIPPNPCDALETVPFTDVCVTFNSMSSVFISCRSAEECCCIMDMYSDTLNRKKQFIIYIINTVIKSK